MSRAMLELIRRILSNRRGHRSIAGNIDHPLADGDKISGLMEIAGWAAGRAPVKSLSIKLDGHPVDAAIRRISRPDVARHHPDFHRPEESGFSFVVDTRGLADGCRLLTIEARNGASSRLVLERRFLLDNAHADSLDKNRLLLSGHISRRETRLDSGPLRVFVEPSSACNISCRMCRTPEYLRSLARDGMPTGVMSEEIFRRILPLLSGAAEIIPTGWGEPFANPRFLSILDEIRNLNPRAVIGFNTNGLLIDDRAAENLVRNRVHHVTLSVDSPFPEDYEKIRVGASFESLVRNLRRLAAVRERLGSAEPRFHFEFVVMRMNVGQMPDFIDFCAEFRPECVNFVNLGRVPPEFEHLRPVGYSAHLAAFEETLRRAERHGIMAVGNAMDTYRSLIAEKIASPTTGAKSQGVFPCYEPFQTIFVNHRGDVAPCCVATTMHMGNLSEESGPAVWNSKRFQRLRQSMLDRAPCEAECRDCVAKRHFVSRPAFPELPS